MIRAIQTTVILLLALRAWGQPLDEFADVPAPASLPATAPATYPARPIVVRTGLMLEQITDVNQRGEAFSVGAVLQMRWRDPNLAFTRGAAERPFRIFHDREFLTYAREHGAHWPDFSITNQQGRRWTQNLRVVVRYDGEALYYERFTTTLQAPDFDFRKFPFDRQVFFIRVQCLMSDRQFLFEPDEDLTAVGQQLGEEEWHVVEQANSGDIVDLVMGATSSRYNFQFIAQRHRQYYIVRIIVPLFLVVLVSYVPFFLKSYAMRIEIGTTTLLILIGFNFAIGADLPRIGYATFLDFILMIAFILTALMVPTGVFLKLIETRHAPTAERVNRVLLVAYPTLYVLAVLVAIWRFMV